MTNMLTETDINRIIEDIELYEGAELQLVLDSGMTHCAYRKQNWAGTLAYYAADEAQMEGPSGRKHVTRLTWNCQPVEVDVLPVDEWLEHLNAELSEGAVVETAWLLNPAARFAHEVEPDEIGM